MRYWHSISGAFGNALFVLAVFALWGAVSAFGILDPFLFPGPVDVLQRLWGLFSSGEIFGDLLSTLVKIAVALSIGSLLGLLLGLLISKWDYLYNAVSPVLDFFRSVPATALFPLFLLIFGVGDSTNTALAVWICAIYLSLHVSKGLRNTREIAIITAKSLKKTELETFLHVRLREALPMIFVGLRTAVSLTVVVIIVTEMFVGTKSGMGKALIDAAYVYDIPKLYAGITIVGIMGYLLNYLVIKMEERVVHWNKYIS